MSEMNKRNFWWGVKTFLILVHAILVIAVCAGVWNTVGGTLGWAAGLLMAVSAYFIIKEGRAHFYGFLGDGDDPKKDEK